MKRVLVAIVMMSVTAVAAPPTAAAAEAPAATIVASHTSRPLISCMNPDPGPWVILFASRGRTRDLMVTAACYFDAKRQARRILGRNVLIVDIFSA
jgi:hypothetical protein